MRRMRNQRARSGRSCASTSVLRCSRPRNQSGGTRVREEDTSLELGADQGRCGRRELARGQSMVQLERAEDILVDKRATYFILVFGSIQHGFALRGDLVVQHRMSAGESKAQHALSLARSISGATWRGGRRSLRVRSHMLS
ncbi:hypothetical protein C8Q74DRAFT_435078 [Fomes fomentarius]|nr:hypothetical protein C8Q74DRAFT_435078 [Fomes fomentarius]